MDVSLDAASAAGRQPAWDPLAGRKPTPAPDGAWLSAGCSKRDDLSARMLLQALQEMGAFRKPGQEHSAGALADELAIVPAHRRLWEALLDILAAARLLDRDGGMVRPTEAIRDLEHRDLAAESAELLTLHPEVTGHLRLIQSCLSEYPRLLRGEVKPLAVLFPGWSMELVEGVYRGDPLSDRLNELAAEAVAARVDSHAAGEPPRILEVGAGTGGSTIRILAAVPPGAGGPTYVYTDVSASFLRHGEQRFGTAYSGMEFRRLDIESDPAAQGFEEGGFEVVVAANVLHATRDLRRTLAHVRRLLHEGGRLVLRELTAALVFTTLTFGLLEGWWCSEDSDLRIPRTPVADMPTWTRLLTEAGFSRVAVLAPTEVGGEVLGQHVFVAEV